MADEIGQHLHRFGDANRLSRRAAVQYPAPAMASGDAPSTDSPNGGDRSTCTPCRGTGRVISNLGGTSHEVECPWCEGTGRFIPGHDAQHRERSQIEP
jgi:hypothetical protein